MRRLSKWLAIRFPAQPQGCPRCPTPTEISQYPPVLNAVLNAVYDDGQIVANDSGLATMSRRTDAPAGAENSFAGSDKTVADSIQGGVQ